jgi:uncharacterized C2H2 Zn-finger protein
LAVAKVPKDEKMIPNENESWRCPKCGAVFAVKDYKPKPMKSARYQAHTAAIYHVANCKGKPKSKFKIQPCQLSTTGAMQ